MRSETAEAEDSEKSSPIDDDGTLLSPLAIYLTRINDTKLLNGAQEKQLAYRIEESDAEARDHMVRANLRLVVSIAREYLGKGLSLQDLIQEGNLGLLRSVLGFDPDMNTRFSTYASYWIKQSIKRALVNTAKTIRIPAYMVELLAKWRRTISLLESPNQLNRMPTEEEIARRLEISPKKLGIIKKAILVYSANPQRESREDDSWALAEMLVDSRVKSPEVQIINNEVLAEVHLLFKELDKREIKVLTLRFGLNGEKPQTLKEIGEKLGLTRERVRQIEAEAVGKLSACMGVTKEDNHETEQSKETEIKSNGRYSFTDDGGVQVVGNKIHIYTKKQLTLFNKALRELHMTIPEYAEVVNRITQGESDESLSEIRIKLLFKTHGNLIDDVFEQLSITISRLQESNEIEPINNCHKPISVNTEDHSPWQRVYMEPEPPPPPPPPPPPTPSQNNGDQVIEKAQAKRQRRKRPTKTPAPIKLNGRTRKVSDAFRTTTNGEKKKVLKKNRHAKIPKLVARNDDYRLSDISNSKKLIKQVGGSNRAKELIQEIFEK